jgi:competence protein ComEA
MMHNEGLRFGRRERASKGPRVRVLAVLLAVATAMAWVVHRGDTGRSTPVADTEVIVEVRGEVMSPGFHPVAPPVTVAKAVRAAGGTTPLDDDRAVLAGSRITVRDGLATISPMDHTLVVGVPVDLNTASVTALDALPGVGPARAEAIIEARRVHGPFVSVDDLARVRGIGPATVDELRSFVVVSKQP